MHGGAKGSGAPKGNRNALKHGRHARELVEFRRLLRELAREARELIEIA
jgi:glucans biosynthesis protein